MTMTLLSARPALLAPLFIAALALACTPEGGGSGGGDNDGGRGGDGGVMGELPGDPVAAAELAAELADYTCDIIANCQNISPAFAVFRTFDAAGGDCETYFRRGFAREYAYDPTITELRFDAAILAECRAAALRSCDLGGALPECGDVLRGARAAGDPCADDIVCAPGLYCTYDLGGADDACEGTCTPRKGAGEPCEYTDECTQDGPRPLSCVFAGVEGFCTAYTTRLDAREGEQCGFLATGDAFESVSCARDLYCEIDYDSELDEPPGVCRRLARVGQPCEGDGDACEGGICVQGTCTAFQIGNAAGAPCDPVQFQICNPFASLLCIDGVCVASEGREGEVCDGLAFGLPCEAGLHCADDGTCQPQLSPGDLCDLDVDYDACRGGYCTSSPDAEEATCVLDEQCI